MPVFSFLLTLTWLIPVLTVVALFFVPSSNHLRVKRISLISTILNLILVSFLVWTYYHMPRAAGDATIDGAIASAVNVPASSIANDGFAWVWSIDWFKFMNIQYNVGVDGIALMMMLLTAIVIFAGVFASWGVKEQSKEFFLLLNVLVSGVFGVFVSIDLFTFFLFYEIAVLPMYLLIGVWGTGKKEYSAMKLTLMLVAGSAFILAGLFALYFYGGHTFDLRQLSQVHFPFEIQKWFFPMLFVGFGVLGALFPFHTWSPDGHASAPTAVSMLHAGVLMKLGGYGCLRVAMFLMPEGAVYWKEWLLILTTINVAYGAFAAIKQTDLKYITAYSSVSHCGLVLFGLAAMNQAGVQGAVLQMVSHGLMTALFFALIGMIYGRTHTRTMTEMGGLLKVMPFLGVSFMIAGFAGLGLPGLSSFVAEVTIFTGSFQVNTVIHKVCTILAVLSIVTTAVYVLRAANSMLAGPLDEKYSQLDDAKAVEKFPVILLIAAMFAMGLLPGWIVSMISGPVTHILSQFPK